MFSQDNDKKLAQLRQAYDSGILDKDTYEAAVRGLGADPNTIHIGGNAEHAVVVAGDNNNINVNQGTSPETLRLRYLEDLAKNTENLPWASLDPEHADPGRESLVLTDIYTAPDTTELEKPESEDQVRDHLRHQADARRISAQEMIGRESKLVLLGDPGSGKSTFVNFFAYIMAKAGSDRQPEKWINLLRKNGKWDHGILFPVRIILRDFAAALDKQTTQGNAELLLSYLRNVFQKPELGNLWELLYDGLLKNDPVYLMLLDGLDEVPAELRQIVVNAIDDFAAKYSAHRYLVTCRIYAYIGQNYQLRKFRQATLMPFSEEQIEHFVSAWYHALFLRGRFGKKDAETRAQSLKTAATRPDLLGLAERPLLMTIMAVLDTFRGRLPDDRIELYNGAIDLLLRRWESRVGGEKGLMETLNIPGLKISDLEAGLYDVAFYVHAGHDEKSDTADIRESLLRERLAPYLNKDWQKAWIFAEYVRERAGLLIRHKPDAYTFPHRTFQEFMAACHLVGMRDYPTESACLIHQDPDRWRIVFVLAAGYASKGQAISSVNALCPFGINDTEDADTDAFRRAEIAGEALLEIGLVKVGQDKFGKAVLKRIRQWLAAAMETDTILVAKERVSAGNVLARLGDPRFDPAKWYLPKDENLGFVKIPAGSFLMGSDKKRDNDAENRELPQHKVTLSAYSINRYPVTVSQFRAFMEDSKYQIDDEDWERYNRIGNHPVVEVSWDDANAYCEWLTEKLGWQIRLPTEAEWEYAARGTDGRIYPWGDEPIDPNKANYAFNIGTTSPVGCYPSGNSLYGISDMAGNVWEWCQDWYEEYNADAVSNPTGPDSGSNRVVRGGGWSFNAQACRSASRGNNSPGGRSFFLGFRLLREAP